MDNTFNEDFAVVAKKLWNDRVGFVKHIIGHKIIDPQQADFLRAVDNHTDISHKAGHGVGKTTTLAWIILHYICLRPDCKIICTAPSKHQLYDVLWAELNKWLTKMKETDNGLIFAQNLEWSKEKLVNLLQPEEWFAITRTATKEKPESMQGFHTDYILVIVDEASGVPDEILETLEGAYGRKETKKVWCANPTRLSGMFFDSFGKDKEMYKTITSSCLKSSIADPKYVKRIIKKYGKDSNMYKVRVLGEFPEADGDSFIPIHFCTNALYRDLMPQNMYKRIMGVDVARHGSDSTVIARRQGDEFLPYVQLRIPDTMQIVYRIAEIARKDKTEAIFIDIIGLGAGVYDRLKELGFPVIPVQVSETKSLQYPERYRRLRDELWGKMRDWLEMGRGKLWDNEDNDLIGQLSTPRYTVPLGKIVIETKEDMKGRSVDSPDIADAHCLTFAAPVSDYNTDLTENEDISNNDDYEVLDKKAGY